MFNIEDQDDFRTLLVLKGHYRKCLLGLQDQPIKYIQITCKAELLPAYSTLYLYNLKYVNI